ncbi:MAG: hypothetical protein ACRDJG_00980 [Actinomycetota bacterium]
MALSATRGSRMLPEPSEYLPLAQLISEARQRQSLSLSGAARAMHKAAQEEGTHCGATRQTILGYERGRIPHPDTLRWLAAAVGLPVDEVAAAAQKQRRYRLELRVLASSRDRECATLDEDVERRDLLGLFSRAAKAGLLASSLRPLSAIGSTLPVGDGAIEAATTISRSYRRLWSTTPAQDLIDLVKGHLRLISRLLASTTSEKDQARLATAGSETALLAAWLAEDQWELDAVGRHYRAALTYAERSRDNLLQAYTAGCMSNWALRTDNGTEAVKLAERAKRLIPSDTPLAAHAWIAITEATAYAAAHDKAAALDALARAERALDAAGEGIEPAWPWVFPINYGMISRYRGYAAASLGLAEMAVPALNEGLEDLGPIRTKRHAYTLGQLAKVHVQTGDVEQACDLAAEAFTIATQFGDAETVMAIRNARVQLIPMSATQAVRKLDEHLLTTSLSLPPVRP